MKTDVKKLAFMGLLTAIVAVLQSVAVLVRPSGFFNISLVLVPIVVGSALYGCGAGAWLGFVFGVVVTVTDSAAFMVINAPATIAVCVLKGVLAGLAAGGMFKLLERKRLSAAVIAAAIVSPVVNTGVFLLGCMLFFLPAVKEWAAGLGYASAGEYMIFGLAGINFIIELVMNILLSSAAYNIIRYVKMRRSR